MLLGRAYTTRTNQCDKLARSGRSISLIFLNACKLQRFKIALKINRIIQHFTTFVMYDHAMKQ